MTGLPVGRPIDLIDVLILPIVDGVISAATDEELRGTALPPGRCGEICVAGAHVLTSYVGDEAAWARTKIRTAERVWHRMGDGGYLDADGELWLVGSVKQSFVRDGIRTFVLPVELALAAIDGIESGTIIELGGRAIVAIESSGDAERDELERRVRAAGIGFDELRMLDAMPRDPRHRSKIDYVRLRTMLER